MVNLSDRDRLELGRAFKQGIFSEAEKSEVLSLLGQQLPGSGSPVSFGSTAPTLSNFGELYLDKKRKENAGKRKDTLKASGSKSYYDDDVDYKTGIQDLKFRAGWARRDNDAEKQAYLLDKVGEQGTDWSQDSVGRYVITPRGQKKLGLNPLKKKVVIDEKGTSLDDVVEFFSAYGAPIALGTAAAIAAPFTAGTSLLGTGATVGLTSLGAAAGTGVGVLADEVIEMAEGYQDESATDVFTRAAFEALIAGLGEGILGGAFVAGSKLLKGPGASLTPGVKGTEVTQSRVIEGILKGDGKLLRDADGGKIFQGNMFENLFDPANQGKQIFDSKGKAIEGLTVGSLAKDVQNMMPNIKNISDKEILATGQKIAEMVFPNKKAQRRNASAFLAAMRQLKNEAGTPDGNKIVEAIQKAFPSQNKIKTDIDTNTEALRKLLSDNISKKSGQLVAPDLDELGARIIAGRNIFNYQTNAGYAAVDDLLAKINPNKRIDKLQSKKAAQRNNAAEAEFFIPDSPLDEIIKSSMGKQSFSKIADELDTIASTSMDPTSLNKFSAYLRNKEGAVSLKELNSVRTVLREVAYNDSLVDGAGAATLKKGERLIDDAMKSYRENLGAIAVDAPKSVKKDLEEVLDVLGATEDFIAKGRGAFLNKQINAIGQKVQNGIPLSQKDIDGLLVDESYLEGFLNVVNPFRREGAANLPAQGKRGSVKIDDLLSKQDSEFVEILKKSDPDNPYIKYFENKSQTQKDLIENAGSVISGGSKEFDDQMTNALAGYHWSKMFGRESLGGRALGKGQGTFSAVDDIADFSVNPQQIIKEFEDNRVVLNRLYGKPQVDEIITIAKQMDDVGERILPEAFELTAGQTAKNTVEKLNALRTQQAKFSDDEILGAIQSNINKPAALQSIGNQVIKPNMTKLEVEAYKDALIKQRVSPNQANDAFVEMTLAKILPDESKLSVDGLLSGKVTSELAPFVGDGATYNKDTLIELLGGGDGGKNIYDNLTDLWNFSKILSDASTAGLSGLKGASDRSAIAGLALLLAPGPTIATAGGAFLGKHILRSRGVMKYLATRPTGKTNIDALTEKSNVLKRLATRAATQPIGAAAGSGFVAGNDVIDEVSENVFQQSGPQGTETEVTETVREQPVRPTRISAPMPAPNVRASNIERDIALGAAGDSPLNQAMLRSRSV
jgi:superoxide dismutase